MSLSRSSKLVVAIVFAGVMMAVVPLRSMTASAQAAASTPGGPEIAEKDRLSPEELLKQMKADHPPLILQVGSHLLFQQAHIPGSEYVGATGTAEGIAALQSRVKALPHSTAIVIYCGCCPWVRCPNIRAAFQELQRLGFTNVHALYLPQNFGTDWTEKGYPVEKGDTKKGDS